MNKPISLVIIFVVGVVLLITNRASEMRYERQDSNVSENISTSTKSFETVASTSTEKAKISDRATIIYTDSGFAPAVVTIKVGGTVNFLNKSSEKDFAVVGLPSEPKTHIYQFENEGEFAFSSVSRPELLGVVVVE